MTAHLLKNIKSESSKDSIFEAKNFSTTTADALKSKKEKVVPDSFHPIICMDYKMVSKRRSVRSNQSQKL